MQISACQFSIPRQYIGPFNYMYYSEDEPAVKAEFENEKLHPDVNSLAYITYEPSYCMDQVRFRCRFVEKGECNASTENTTLSFDELTGTVSL